MSLDLSDPRISMAYDEVRSGKKDINWIMLSILPSLPGSSEEAAVVTTTGSESLTDLSAKLGSGPAYIYARIDQKFALIFFNPGGPSVQTRAKILNYNRQIQNVFKERDAFVDCYNPSEIPDVISQASRTASVNKNRLPSAMSLASISSDHNVDAKAAEENERKTQVAQQRMQELHSRQAAGRNRVKEFQAERQAETNRLKEKSREQTNRKNVLRKEYEQLAKGKNKVLTMWINYSNGRFWKQKYMVIQDAKLHLFNDPTETKPHKIFNLKGAKIEDLSEEHGLPYLLALSSTEILSGDLEKPNISVQSLDCKDDFLRLTVAIEVCIH